MQKNTLDKFFKNGGSICPYAKIAADNEAIVYANTAQIKDQLIAFLTDSSKQVFVVIERQIPDTHQEAKDLIYSMFSKTFTELVKLQTQLSPEEIATFIKSQMAMFDDPNSSQRPMLGHDNKPMYAIGMSPNYDKKHPRYAPILCLVVTWMVDIQLARMQYPNSVTKIRAAMKAQTGSVYDADELYLPEKDPFRNEDHDIQEAFDHVYNWLYSSEGLPEKLDASMFEIQHFPAWTLQQIEDFEEEIEFDAWLELEKDELVGLPEDEILDTLHDYRGWNNWAELNYQWYKDNDFPAIVLIKSSHYTGLADGRGRINVATALGVETLPVILLTRKIEKNPLKHKFQRSNPEVSELEVLRSYFCEAAQEVYDNWDQDDEGHSEEYAYGGICHDIAEAICEVLEENDIGCTTFSQSIGDVHVWAVADIEGDAYRVDISPYMYEQGGGYTWKKILDIIFEDNDVIIEPMGDPFSDYLED